MNNYIRSIAIIANLLTIKIYAMEQPKERLNPLILLQADNKGELETLNNNALDEEWKKLETQLLEYVEKKKFWPDSTKNFNALHYAVYRGDIPFIKDTVTRLITLKKTDYLNQVGNPSDNPTLSLDLILTDLGRFKSETTDNIVPGTRDELVNLYIHANALVSLKTIKHALSSEGVLKLSYQTRELLLQKTTCSHITEYKNWYNNLDDYHKKLLKELEQFNLNILKKYHSCSTCNFNL